MFKPNADWLISQPHLIQKLDLSRAKFYRLRDSDPTFPKPIKDGDHRQASAYYIMTEVLLWLQHRVTKRDAT